MVIDFIEVNPELRYKVQSFLSNINSEQVLELFDKFNNESLFEGFKMQKERIVVSSPYESLSTSDMTSEDRQAIEGLLKKAYGNSFDAAKMLSSKINSVVVGRGEEQIVACIYMDAERIYSVAATRGIMLIKMIRDIVRNNYNIWGTINSSNTKLISIALMGGMRIEDDAKVVQKILTYKDPKYATELRVRRDDGLLAFDQVTSDDYPQVMVRN